MPDNLGRLIRVDVHNNHACIVDATVKHGRKQVQLFSLNIDFDNI
jgi:hypothetical protein